MEILFLPWHLPLISPCGPRATGSHIEIAQLTSIPVRHAPFLWDSGVGLPPALVRVSPHEFFPTLQQSSIFLSCWCACGAEELWAGFHWFLWLSASRSCALLGNPIFIPKEKCRVITSSPRSMNNMFCCNILISQRLLEFCREASSFSKQPQASKCLLFTLCCQLWTNHHCFLPINSLSSLLARVTRKETKLFGLADWKTVTQKSTFYLPS